jgi:signal transduction histidine kinase/phage shock protein PspC (stress-responsive transcriptional regulator)
LPGVAGAASRIGVKPLASGVEVVDMRARPAVLPGPAPSPYHAGVPAAGEARKLYRASDGRLVAGVAAGLAEHLRLTPIVVRIAFALLVAAGGAGVLMYAAFWAVVPQCPVDPALSGRSPTRRGRSDPGQLVALAALAVGAVLLFSLAGTGAADYVVWPVVVGGLGVALLWREADDSQRARWIAVPGRVPWRALPAAAGSGRAGLARGLAGIVLVLAGMAGFLAANHELAQAREGLLAIVVVVVGLALVSGPWWLRLVGELSTERRARIREQERAELAAHVHDSVLQTLALIQKSADDPRQVAKLARSQERELRTWIYRTPTVATPANQLGATLESVAADVEEQYGVPIEVVAVGDCALDDRLAALAQAAREAMVNAAKHSGAATVAVYAEVEPDRVAVFIRDRGKGFTVDSVAGDRAGIRESISGRMTRHGGTAVVHSSPEDGTEVVLELPVVAAGSTP